MTRDELLRAVKRERDPKDFNPELWWKTPRGLRFWESVEFDREMRITVKAAILAKRKAA